jgi:hypothetical protein
MKGNPYHEFQALTIQNIGSIWMLKNNQPFSKKKKKEKEKEKKTHKVSISFFLSILCNQ